MHLRGDSIWATVAATERRASGASPLRSGCGSAAAVAHVQHDGANARTTAGGMHGACGARRSR